VQRMGKAVSAPATLNLQLLRVNPRAEGSAGGQASDGQITVAARR
jgi:hypothetical protein